MQHISMSNSPSASVVYAPPLTTLPRTPVETDIFWLQFVKGNISWCAGCGQRNLHGVDGKPKQPPYDLRLQHKEQVIFENAHTGMHQLSSDLRNVYYHTSVGCVTQKFSTFNPTTDVKVSGEVRAKLTAVHLPHFLNEFGLSFLNKYKLLCQSTRTSSPMMYMYIARWVFLLLWCMHATSCVLVQSNSHFPQQYCTLIFCLMLILYLLISSCQNMVNLLMFWLCNDTIVSQYSSIY